MTRLLLLVAAVAWLPPAAAAVTHAERCARYAEELGRIERAKKRGGSEVRLHKLESQRQKVLAAQAKHRC
jgi:hypothetical protein